MSWLMKTTAIELRVTSLNRQRSHTQRLLNLLLDDQPHTLHTGMYEFPEFLMMTSQPHWSKCIHCICSRWRDRHGGGE